MNKLKEKWVDVGLVVICIVALFFISNRNFRIIAGVAIIFCIVDFFSKPVEEKEPETNEELLSDEEMEQELLDDGEFSYDNYDEVCCPKCGAYLGKGVTECDQCGYGKLEFPEVCPSCGKVNEDQMSFCAYCNYKFEKKVYAPIKSQEELEDEYSSEEPSDNEEPNEDSEGEQ